MDDPSAFAQSLVRRSYRPRVVVVPDRATDLDWLATGITEEVVNGLSRIARFDVMSHHSSVGLSLESAAAIAEEFDVKHVIVCRVEADASSVAVSIGLHDRSGVRRDLHGRGPLDGIQSLRDRLVCDVAELVGYTPVSSFRGNGPVAQHLPSSTYLAILKALQALWRFDRAGHEQATAIVDAAILDDPHCAPALAFRGFLAARAFRSGWIASREDAVALAQRGCDAARAAPEQDPLTLWTTSFCEAMLFRRYPEAADLIELAHVLDPRASHILTWGSLFLSYNQEFTMGVAYASRSIACSPRDPMAVTQGFGGALAAVHAQEFEMALRFCERVLDRAPRMPNVLRIKAVACQQLGRHEDARAAVAAVRTLDPTETIEVVARVNPLREWGGFQRFLDALRAAGLPDRL